MLELKKYQKDVLETLDRYLTALSQYKGIELLNPIFLAFESVSKSERKYEPLAELPDTPFVCIQVPTGGGKTLIAAHAVDYIYRQYLTKKNKTGLVMWLAPSDVIRLQTLKNLCDRNHPYREALDSAFNNRVIVFDAESALRITKNEIENYICIIVATYQAFRRDDPKNLRNFKANGSLMSHFENIKPEIKRELHLYEDSTEPIESLANVIKINEPLIVVDEGHNATSDLSIVMLKDFNPSFIIEYTATPREGSNILVKIGAHRLKEEAMVKIPVWVTLEQDNWQGAISRAIDKLKDLKRIAEEEFKKTGEYIRPIMLIQTQNINRKKDNTSIEEVKEYLLRDKRIPEHEIARRISGENEIDSIDLFKPDCPIKYIMTVKALGEGWDCSFAYILATIARKKSSLDVAQILGRILRLPHAKIKTENELNDSYVFTSSPETDLTLRSVMEAMEQNGYESYSLRTTNENGKGKPDQTEFKKVTTDNDISVPLVSVTTNEGKLRAFSYRSDLCPGFSLEGEGYKFELADIEDIYAKVFKIDVEEKGKITAKEQKDLILKSEGLFDYSLGDLCAEVTDNVRFLTISRNEIALFVQKAINLLLEKTGKDFSLLALHKYDLAKKIKMLIQKSLDTYTKKIFERLQKENRLKAKINYQFEDPIRLFIQEPKEYKKHFYERAHFMNKEEKLLADEFERADNILWWLRNVERQGFYIQGFLNGRFYPDFVVKTKKGNYFVLEYKGEQLVSADEAKYKDSIGKIWQSLAGDKYFFRMVEKKDINAISEEIKNN